MTTAKEATVEAMMTMCWLSVPPATPESHSRFDCPRAAAATPQDYYLRQTTP
jgi:hypothetical protein